VFPTEEAGLFHEYCLTPERVISVAAIQKQNKVGKKMKRQGKLNMRIISESVLMLLPKIIKTSQCFLK